MSLPEQLPARGQTHEIVAHKKRSRFTRGGDSNFTRMHGKRAAATVFGAHVLVGRPEDEDLREVRDMRANSMPD